MLQSVSHFRNLSTSVGPPERLWLTIADWENRFAVLGSINQGDYVPTGFEVYFNRTDVKKAINAPLDSNWQQCTDVNVFANAPNRSDSSLAGDRSLGPAQNGVISRIIEKTQNVFIGSGDLDMILPTNGTLLAIQNMTWGGLRGLQEYPGNDLYVPYHPEYNGGSLAGAGLLGSWGSERGLVSFAVLTTDETCC
jgi:carboxypeptidase D